MKYLVVLISIQFLIFFNCSLRAQKKPTTGLLTSVQLLSLAHQNHEPAVNPSLYKSTIADYHYIDQLGKDILAGHFYSIYEDSLISKYCIEFFDNPWDTYYYTYLYDFQKRISKVIEHYRYIDIYTYNTEGKVSGVLTTLIDGTAYQRLTYTYDTTNYLTSELEETWTGSAWENAYRTTYTNNSSGSPIVKIMEYWNSFKWINSDYYSYIYDSNNLLVTLTRKSWNNGIWEDYYRDTYIYNDNLLTSQIEEFIYSGVWTISGRTIYSYNTDDTISYEEVDYWNGSLWIKSYYYNYNYPAGKLLRLAIYPTNFNYIPGSKIPVQWVGAGIMNVNIKLSTDDGNTWNISASGVPDTGDYTTYIPAPANEYPKCKIRIEDAADPNIYDQCTGTFSLLFVYDTLTHNTGKVKMTVFNNGTIGSDGNIGQGFSFMDSPNAMYSGGIFFGDTTTGAYGMLPSYRIKDLEKSAPMYAFTSNSYFNTISTAYYSDSAAGNPYKVLIKEQTFGKTGNPYIFYHYSLLNRSYNTLSSFYIGVTADWDIGNSSSNLGGYSLSRNMAYQYDASKLNPNYYGIVALSGMSGAYVTSDYFSTYYTDRKHIIQVITSPSSTPVSAVNDYRTLMGSGPYNIPSDSTKEVSFAFVSGITLADLETNADLAIAEWSAVVGIKDKYLNFPLNYSLEQNYPNPFNPATIIEYTLPKETLIKIELFNSLGQKVKEIIKGVQNAGTHKIYLDGSDLSSGVYFYRLQAGSFVETKKMMLLK